MYPPTKVGGLASAPAPHDNRVIVMHKTDIILAKVAWELSLKYIDNDFDDGAIGVELKAQGIEADDNLLVGMINRMLELELLDVTEIGSLYRCSWTCTSSSNIEIVIMPCIDELSEAVLAAIDKAIKPFGDLVDVEVSL